MSEQVLATLWRSIEDSGALDRTALRFLETGVVLPTGPVLAGIDGARERHLCIPAPTTELGKDDKRSRHVTIEVRHLLNQAGREMPFVDIHCRKADLNPLFQIVAADILAETQDSADSPFLTAHLVLERWRELLEPAETAPLGPKQLGALLAELLLLERLGRNGAPPLDFWQGPDKGPHDFVCGAVDFEVKSTLATLRREIDVHGLGQLTEAPGTRLYLWWVRLRSAPGRGTTVPDTVDRLISQGAERVGLMKKLMLEGYVQSDSAAYRKLAFEVADSALYVVDSTFPRLTPASFAPRLPAQITRVNYTINLDAPAPTPLEPAAADEVFEQVGSYP